MDVSVVLPCLNEAQTVGACVREALAGIQAAGVKGEVIVADNGSEDGSQAAAAAAGARIVQCSERGYGAALQAGFAAASGDIIAMADADGTYNLSHLPRFLERFESSSKSDDICRIDSTHLVGPAETRTASSSVAGSNSRCDMVMGNRFAGGIEPGAMPFSHRYFGVPALTWFLNILFGTRLGDAHCGLRAFTREAYYRISPRSKGMEFASELIVRAARLGLTIEEVPTVLRPGPRDRVPHLRTWRDGFRHVHYLLAARMSSMPSERFSETPVRMSSEPTQKKLQANAPKVTAGGQRPL